MPPKPVPIFSQPPTVIPSRPNDSHDLATTLAFVETLDTLPGELTKTFGDLRELDAVLNSTTANVTRKLRALTATLQSINQDVELAHGNLIPRGADRNKHEDIRQVDEMGILSAPCRDDQQLLCPNPLGRFQLLLEIAEELTRYKIGVEDKVRVSGQACDTLVAHQAHLQALLTNSSVLLASPSMKFIERPKIQGDAAHIRRQRASPTRAAVTNGYGSAYGGSDQENTSQPTRGTNVMAYDADDVTPSKRRRTGKEKNAMGMDTWDLEETLLGRRSPALGKKPVASVAISQAYKEKKIVSKKRKYVRIRVSGSGSNTQTMHFMISRNSPAESLREHSIHHRLGKHDAMQVGPDLSEHSQTVEDRRAMGSSSHTTSSNHSVPPSAKHSESIRSSNDTNNFLGSVKGYASKTAMTRTLEELYLTCRLSKIVRTAKYSFPAVSIRNLTVAEKARDLQTRNKWQSWITIQPRRTMILRHIAIVRNRAMVK
ncbi:hypothetical protein QFC19_006297 [Naganishia cerealis]|uniref:Uncharacterized protein n=1 Tax=Naganishia cerealis TaxID=610337 RepID=A0ACC2VGK4_9TREE|nr:hypothetical protein QFC19_006297 [Naganishia cerealis]